MAGTQSKELGVEVKGLIVVGRHDPNGDIKADLDLSPYNAGTFGVSRQHVILIPTDEGPCIIDLNSTNGTWINGLYLEPGRRYRLRTNDKVELGSLKLLVRVMAPAEQQSPKDPK
jgi:pSer/pThr/pTyr-binding forkhead associated (FHA) protein